MKGEIDNAVAKLNDRKRAAGVKMNGERTQEALARLVFSGLDIDMDELDEFRAAATGASLDGMQNQIREGVSDSQSLLVHALAGLWVDGIATGIVLQQEREK